MTTFHDRWVWEGAALADTLGKYREVVAHMPAQCAFRRWGRVLDGVRS
jgi:hypothetical protein